MREEQVVVKGQSENMFSRRWSIRTSFDPKPSSDSKIVAGSYKPFGSPEPRKRFEKIVRKHCTK